MDRTVEEAVSVLAQSPAVTPTTVDLSIVIVNWNVRELLRRCLASIAGSDALFIKGLRSTTESTARTGQPWHAEVIVVDNASGDDSVAMLAEAFPWVTVIANRDNAGFTRGNNQGLEMAHGRYLLLLNPDTELTPQAIHQMLAHAEAHPEIGILGPQLRYADGSVQSSRRRFPTLATFFLESTVLQRLSPHNRVLDRYFVLDRPDDAITQVDWVVGACMLVRRTVVDTIGGFDEGFFMYSEELDLCHRAVDAGWQVVYFPPAVITHFEGKSSEQVIAARHINFHTSRVRYVRKYHGAATAEAVRIFLLATFSFQWAEESLKWLASWIVPSQRRNRTMRRGRMAAYRQVMRSQLR
jgi:hypothetical protein